MIEIKSVNFQYFGTKKSILQDFSLKIEKGECIGIIGPTGSGKSTICYLLNGLIPHYFNGYFSGFVSVCGKNPSEETVEKMSKVVGFMLQEPSLQIFSPQVESEITFGMENLAISENEIDKRLKQVLKELDIESLRYRSTSDLSEGEKQKVVLASILAMDPDVLVLDESSSMVDLKSKQELVKILVRLNEIDKKTIILIDHDFEIITQVAKRVLLINNGLIVADKPTHEMFVDSNLLINNGLIPPVLTKLFNELKNKKLPVSEIPSSYVEALKILRSWL